MNDLLFNILLTLATAAGMAIAGMLIPWLKKAAASAEVYLKASNHALAAEIGYEAVYAAEQTFTGAKQGEAKYKAAVSTIGTQLQKHGITMTDEQISMMIEAVVGQMNRGTKID